MRINYPLFITFLSPLICINLTAAQPAIDYIINGSVAAEGKWPFMVSLHDKRYAEPAHRCGGVIISDTHVLTAAHCVSQTRPDDLQIVTGTTNLRNGSGERFDVTRIQRHPAFDEDLLTSDIALLTLDGRTTINPVTLIGESEAGLKGDGASAQVLGWGFIDPEYPILPHRLHEASLPIHSDDTCLNNLGMWFFSDHMICAGVLSTDEDTIDGVDSCRGDSGGPMLVDDGGTYKLVGLTSWGFECASHKTYGAYTDVHHYLDWLEPLLNPASVLVEAVEEFKRELRMIVTSPPQHASSIGAEDQWDLVHDIYSLHQGTDALSVFPRLNRKTMRKMDRKMRRIIRSFYKHNRRVRASRSLIRLLDRMVSIR